MSNVPRTSAPTLTDLLFDRGGVGRCLVAPDGAVVRANAEWLRSTGFSEEQVVGRSILELFPATREMALAMYARARAGHRVEVPRHVQTVNGRETSWEGSVEPVAMEGGTGLLISAREVSADPAPSSRGSPDVALLQQISDESADAIYAKDRGGRFLYVNAAALALIGKPLDHVIGRTDAEILNDPAAAREVMQNDGRIMVRGVAEEVEERIPLPDGTERIWLSRKTPYRDASGDVAGLLGISRDITERRRAQDALRASEEQVRALFRNMTLGFFLAEVICDERGAPIDYRYLDANPAFEALTGLRPADVLGRTVLEVLPGVERSWIEKYGRVALTGEPAHVHEFAAPLGRHYETVAYSPRRGQFACLFSDVTARKQAEESLRASEASLKRLLDTAYEGIWMLDLAGVTTYVNQRMAEMLGRTRDEMVGRSAFELVWPGDIAAGQDEWHERVRASGGRAGEFRYLHASGRPVWCFVNSSSVTDAEGRATGVLGMFSEITARKEAENEVQAANERLREADRRKDEFLATLSHELRNPLAPIRNSAYILQHAPPGSEQARRARTVIQRQTEHLTRLVDDLLDVTRIARGKIELRRSRVELREVVTRAAEDFRVLLHDRGVEFQVVLPDEPIALEADATRITQVVGNLLHNASKFTRPGDAVTLSVTRTPDAAELRVVDTGAGIEPALLPRIFEPFVQGERTLARADGGLGLGLALVKGITELHGGAIVAASEGKGKGASFVVRLPLAQPAVPRATGDGRASSPPGGRRVLVVDDNLDAAETLADILRLRGHLTELAHDGPSAIEKARANPPQVVLCDIGLPGMNGYEVAKALRAGGADGLRLIAVSGYAQPEDVRRAIEAGFDGHLAKPCDPDELERLLR